MTDKTAETPLTFEIERTVGIVVVHCRGRLVAGATDLLYISVKQLVPDNKRIVLDLNDLTRMDSMGIGTVVRLYVSARAAGCSLELINVGTPIRRVLETANLLSAFSLIGEHGIKMG